MQACQSFGAPFAFGFKDLATAGQILPQPEEIAPQVPRCTLLWRILHLT
jgi:hypothetical protein